MNLCASSPCHNGGQCEQTNSTSTVCKCSSKFTGELCEIEVDACTQNTCLNGGTCIEAERKLVCECPNGFVGDFCEIKQNFCSNEPCESGQCLNTANGFLCKCPPGVIGRRCHLRPCDYFPCHKNAICVDLKLFPATRSSFTCRCPKGLKGNDCLQIDSPCDRLPCRNNGICEPKAIRRFNDVATLDHSEDDDQIYEEYTCRCAPYFYGKNCEIFTTPDYVMEFVKPGVYNYVKMNGPTRNLTEVSLTDTQLMITE